MATPTERSATQRRLAREINGLMRGFSVRKVHN
jgi:hypothetical protein